MIHRWVGFDLRTGPLVNLAATLLMLLLLYRLGRDLLGGVLPALACCSIWMLSPAVVQIDLEARHYQLLGLIALAMFSIGRRLWNGRGTPQDLFLFTLLNALGFLTHYYYGFLLVPGTVVMLWKWGLTRRTFSYLASLFVSLTLFLLVFPEFFDFVPHYLADRRAIAGGPVDHGQRLRAIATKCTEFLSHWKALRYGMTLSGIGVVLWAFMRSGPTTRTRWRTLPEWSVLHLNLVWYFVFTALLYVGGVSPQQAVGGEYFAYFWPLCILAFVQWAQVFLPYTLRLTIFLPFALHLVLACWAAVHHSPYLTNVVPTEWLERMSTSDVLYTNEGRRGYLPRLVIQLPKDLPLRVCTPTGLEDLPTVNVRSISYWLVRPDEGGTVPPYVDRLIDRGFIQTVLRSDRHELRYFVRAE
jgi:hypothetical protein